MFLSWWLKYQEISSDDSTHLKVCGRQYALESLLYRLECQHVHQVMTAKVGADGDKQGTEQQHVHDPLLQSDQTYLKHQKFM
jgi:hypothetical protein